MAISPKSDVKDAILGRLDTIPELKYTAFDKVRTRIDDFQDFEFPAVQLYDVAQINRHENLRIFVQWTIALELIMKTTTAGLVDQESLWNLLHDIERKIWERPVNLGVSGVVDMVYNGSETDLHSLGDDVYFARMDITVQFYQPLVDDC